MHQWPTFTLKNEIENLIHSKTYNIHPIATLTPQHCTNGCHHDASRTNRQDELIESGLWPGKWRLGEVCIEKVEFNKQRIKTGGKTAVTSLNVKNTWDGLHHRDGNSFC